MVERMKKAPLLIALLCVTTGLKAQEDYPDAANDRAVKRYLQSLSAKDLGRKLKGVRLPDGTTALPDHTFLHRIELTSKRAQIYVLREGSLAIGAPMAFAWVAANGKALELPETPTGEPRETAYIGGEVHTYPVIDPGSGLIEISCPTERWIKSLQEPRVAATWGVESMATINDPDGFTNVRDEEGKLIATIKEGERFLAVKPDAKATLREVYLSSGIVGYVHGSRIRLLPEEPIMKLNFEPCKQLWKQSLARREAAAKDADGEEPSHPNAYYPTLLRGSEGDIAGLARFFARKFEDGVENTYVRDAWKLLHLAGDDRFADMLIRQAPELRDVAAMFSDEWTTSPISNGKEYLNRHFPKSYAILFGT